MGCAVRQFEKEVSFRIETGVGYVTWNCMGRAVRQFEKEVSSRLETGAGYFTWNCTGRAVRQLEKAVSFRLSRNKSRKCYMELYGTRRPPVR